jgi:hypothetical protein
MTCMGELGHKAITVRKAGFIAILEDDDVG